MRMLHENAAWECCMRMPHENATWEWCMRMLHENAAWECRMRMLHENAAWEYPMRLLNENASWECLKRIVISNQKTQLKTTTLHSAECHLAECHSAKYFGAMVLLKEIWSYIKQNLCWLLVLSFSTVALTQFLSLSNISFLSLNVCLIWVLQKDIHFCGVLGKTKCSSFKNILTGI